MMTCPICEYDRIENTSDLITHMIEWHFYERVDHVLGRNLTVGCKCGLRFTGGIKMLEGFPHFIDMITHIGLDELSQSKRIDRLVEHWHDILNGVGK